MLLNAEEDGPVCLMKIKLRTVGAGKFVDTVRSYFGIGNAMVDM